MGWNMLKYAGILLNDFEILLGYFVNTFKTLLDTFGILLGFFLDNFKTHL